MQRAIIAALTASLLALGYSAIKSRLIGSIRVESEILRKISGYIADGAKAFLSREYLVMAGFVPVVILLLAIFNGGRLKFQAVTFAIGALCSALAGWFGMRVATKANARTAQAATKGMGPALSIAFAGGSVMGMTVSGSRSSASPSCCLHAGDSRRGARTISRQRLFPVSLGVLARRIGRFALFARCGGGDIHEGRRGWADLVGKVEVGLPWTIIAIPP